jgi:predicted nucleic acid-binding protein
MCLLIDTCALSRVFNQKNSEHAQFKPIFDWIYKRQGTVVYGGSRYLSELSKAERYLRLFGELRRLGQARVLDKDSVDAAEKVIRKKVADPTFNDAHVAAIARLAGCRLICTNDQVAIPFLKSAALYKKGKKPKIYTGLSQKNLLLKPEVTKCCTV